MEDIRETLTTEIKELKNKQVEMKNTTEIQNHLDVMTPRMEESKEQIVT